MHLSENFQLSEFAVSGDHPGLASLITFSDFERYKAWRLVNEILQPVREEFNHPVQITSGKRSKDLNLAVGGHRNSHHLFLGEDAAVDFTIAGIEMEDVFDFIEINCPYGELILYKNRKFIHASLPTTKKFKKSFIRQ